MNENLQNKIVEILDQMAQSFGTTTEYLWSILVTQAYVNAIIMIVGLIIIVGLDILYIILLKRNIIKIKKDFNNEESNGYFPISFLVGGFLFTVTLLLVINIPDMLTGLINPEYWALQEILERF